MIDRDGRAGEGIERLMSHLQDDAVALPTNTFVNKCALVDRLLGRLKAVYSPWGRVAVTSEFKIGGRFGSVDVVGFAAIHLNTF